jgi:cell division protein FtsW
MVAFGAVILYSASSVIAELKFGSSWHFVLRQGLWLVPSLLLMMFLKRTHYQKLQNSTVAFAAIGLVLMLLGMVFFVDSAHHRWLRMGPFGLQPSELAKPALVSFWRTSSPGARRPSTRATRCTRPRWPAGW